jgi:hypothetical protein
MVVALSCVSFCCTQAAVVSDPRAGVGKDVDPGHQEQAPDGLESTGTTFIVDNERGMAGIHDVKAARCYLMAALPESVPEVSVVVKQGLGERVHDDHEAVPEYHLTEDDLVEDRSLLPASLREGCEGLPLYWIEPSGLERPDTGEDSQIQSRVRFCRRVCVFGVCRDVCIEI